MATPGCYNKQRDIGASGGTRTLNPVRATDFKSVAYTNSATEALHLNYNQLRSKYLLRCLL